MVAVFSYYRMFLRKNMDIEEPIIEETCPECGPIILKWSGVKCSKCEWWFCY